MELLLDLLTLAVSLHADSVLPPRPAVPEPSRHALADPAAVQMRLSELLRAEILRLNHRYPEASKTLAALDHSDLRVAYERALQIGRAHV